jgi:hypothetical protein
MTVEMEVHDCPRLPVFDSIPIYSRRMTVNEYAGKV